MLRQIAYRLMKNELCLYAMARVLCARHGCRLRRDGDTYVLIRGYQQIRLARKHLLYAQEIANHFVTYFSQVVPCDLKERKEADYSGPALHTLANGLAFEIASFPEELVALDAYFRFNSPQSGDLVFDIGAYCGVFTHALSRAVGESGRVIAFEPDPLNVQLLRRNIERHVLHNVTVVNAAVSDCDGTAQFNSEGSLGSALTASLDRPPAAETTMVRVLSLESACSKYGIPSFIKIDAEGAEIEIIRGARKLLASNPIYFALDTNHRRGGGLTNGPIESLFREINYGVESALCDGFMTTWAGPSST